MHVLVFIALLFVPFAQAMETCEQSLPSYDYSPAQITEICGNAQSAYKTVVNEIARIRPQDATFNNTVLRLESASSALGDRLIPVNFLKYVSTDSKVRKAADACETQLFQLPVDVYSRKDLYNVIKAYKDKGEQLTSADQLLLDETFSLFKRNGLELSVQDQQLFIEKKKKLAELEAEFSSNLVEYSDHLDVTRAELEGLSENYIGGLEKTTDGKFRVTLAYPHYFPFMENAKNAEARKRLELKFFRRGGDRNRQLLEQAIELRGETAKLLGYANHAEYVLERRMAKSPHAVTTFLTRLVDRLKPKGMENLQEMLEAKKLELHSPDEKEIYSWDWRYYENLLRKTKYQVDSQLVKEYFPLQTVIEGMLEIYQTLLGVTFEAVQGGPAWHKDALLYRVMRNRKNIAYFYFDLFPREGKYEHAAEFPLVIGYEKDGCYQKPVAAIVANFNPPSPGTPALLEHSEVVTFFHEFGHITHQVLTKAKYATFSGTSVKTDFVEAPSQMLENWVWEKGPLQKLSGHYLDTSKKLPDELLDKMVKARLLNAGIKNLRQLSFGLIDMTYHTTEHVDSTEIYQRFIRDVMLIPLQPDAIPQASFGHLMGGYDAGYYGYMWSLVFAQDMFATRFAKEGLLNPVTGGDYLKWILEPGGTEDPSILLRGFLGREPNEDAFLKSLGL
ncbi:MAG: Zn-dependent oligopeptidase [Deltaproteobacteria bacterium]|nr:Zn-dependent oligopeptidase [Deltaproteobacteria bacterium]